MKLTHAARLTSVIAALAVAAVTSITPADAASADWYRDLGLPKALILGDASAGFRASSGPSWSSVRVDGEVWMKKTTFGAVVMVKADPYTELLFLSIVGFKSAPWTTEAAQRGALEKLKRHMPSADLPGGPFFKGTNAVRVQLDLDKVKGGFDWDGPMTKQTYYVGGGKLGAVAKFEGKRFDRPENLTVWKSGAFLEHTAEIPVACRQALQAVRSRAIAD